MKNSLVLLIIKSWKQIIGPIKLGSSVIRSYPRATAVILFLILIIMIWFWRRPLSGQGGLPIPGRIEIAVAPFLQGDPRWAEEMLGSSEDTLESAGCAVTSAAMVLQSYGVPVDPKTLNDYLINHDGYEGSSWIKWEVAATYPPGLVEHKYEDLPSYGLIDWNILRGNPVIVRIRRPKGTTHFVVIVGKQGWDYLICDPGFEGKQGVYPFAELGAPMEALRYYSKKTELSSYGCHLEK